MVETDRNLNAVYHQLIWHLDSNLLQHNLEFVLKTEEQIRLERKDIHFRLLHVRLSSSITTVNIPFLSISTCSQCQLSLFIFFPH